MKSATERLAEAALAGKVVEVTRHDGKTFTGTPVAAGEDAFVIRTGHRGRPAVVEASTVQSVTEV